MVRAGLAGERTERDRDAQRKREKRYEAARIVIPDVVDPVRREKCLADPERFLRTYHPDRYSRAFSRLHKRLIDQMYERMEKGGKKAMAAPRRRGKTEITKGMVEYGIFRQFIRFPLVIGATTVLAGRTYQDFRKKLEVNNLLYQDFPEICHPVRELQGAPQRAARQHVDGMLTRIVWTATDYLQLPYVPGSPYGGVKMSYYGLDAAFRGANIESDRPDFIMIDDPETRESARSIPQIKDRKEILMRDIEGLEGDDDTPLTIVVLTTCQNRYCLSFQLTDIEQQPSYDGERWGWFTKWPKTVDDPTDESKLGLWSDYITKRRQDQMSGDRFGLNAVAFYILHRHLMDAGCEVIADEFKPRLLDDGTPTVYSAIQEGFNKIADTDLASFRTEHMNDPEAEDEIQTLKLTKARVMSRFDRDREQYKIPAATQAVTIGLDLGKYLSHFVVNAWEDEGCVPNVVDYNVMETYGLTRQSDDQAVEHALAASLEVWGEMVQTEYNPLMVLIDSGKWPRAVYNFCRAMGPPFFPSKGQDTDRFRVRDWIEDKIQPFEQCWAHNLDFGKIVEHQCWLFNFDAWYWKKWVHERFMCRPFDDDGNRVDGSLCLFHHGGDSKRHLTFASHICAEEEQLVPIEGKELKRTWFVKNRNNHYLDAQALACLAGSVVGIRLVDDGHLLIEDEPRDIEHRDTPRDPFTRRAFVASQR